MHLVPTRLLFAAHCKSKFKFKQLLFYSQNCSVCDVGIAVKPAVHHHFRPFQPQIQQNPQNLHHQNLAQQALLMHHLLMTVRKIKIVLCRLHMYLFFQVDQAISAVMEE